MASDSDDIHPHPLPGYAVPRPMQRTSSPDLDNFLDPLLSLTPDKPQKSVQVSAASQRQRREGNERQRVSNKENNGFLTAQHKRQDGNCSKKGATSPVLMSHPSVLFQQERTNQDQILQKNLKILKHTVPGKDSKKEMRSKDEIASARVNKLTKPNVPKDTVVQGNLTVPRSCVLNKKKPAEDRTVEKKHVRIVDPKVPLSTPELHSTAVLGHQLKQMETQTFNAEEVVVKTLQDSEAARLALSERVAEAANIERNEKKYSGLVSVCVPVESTLQRVVTQRLQRVKRRTQRPSKASEVPPPDILEMFSPSMIVESANLDVSGLVPPKVKPAPVDPDMTFDLYRHMQCWDLGH